MARNRSCYISTCLWHVIFNKKEEYMNELLHHIFLFLSIVIAEYTMTRNTLWKRVFVTTFPEGNKNFVYITTFIVSNRHFRFAKKKTSSSKS